MTDLILSECSEGDFMHPTIIEGPVSRIVGFGDVHGDPEVVINFFTRAECIEETTSNVNSIEFNAKKYRWIGEDTIVVQVGDQIDSCRPQDDLSCQDDTANASDIAMDIAILRFFTDLNELAKIYGGRVISLLGNHEMMNIMGNMKYVSYKNIMQFAEKGDTVADALIKRKKYFAGHVKKYLACTRLSTVIVNGIIFMHGGFMKTMVKKYTPNEINVLVQKWLLNKTKNKKIITDKNSIFWTRTLGLLPSDNDNINTSKECDKEIKDIFKLWNISGLVIGHTTQTKHDGINSTCNKRVWRIDGGPSHAFDRFRNNKKITVQSIEIKFNSNNEPIYNIIA